LDVGKYVHQAGRYPSPSVEAECGNPYFSTETPATPVDEPPHKRTQGLGEILTALIKAGIELEFVHEHPFSVIQRSPEMVQDGDGAWRFESDIDLSLLVTVKGRRQSGTE
jgi:hypothetical protein